MKDQQELGDLLMRVIISCFHEEPRWSDLTPVTLDTLRYVTTLGWGWGVLVVGGGGGGTGTGGVTPSEKKELSLV